MLTAHFGHLNQDDLAAKAAAFTHDPNNTCRKVSPDEITAFLMTIPEDVRIDFAFIELYQSLQKCGIEFGGDCGLWDALEMSYGHALARRPTGCPREPSVEAALLAARCAALPCKLPPLKSVRCWWLYALGGAILGTVVTAVVCRRHKPREQQYQP